MMSRLAGKTIAVTAAAQGIGRAAAERMAREGAKVLASDIDVSSSAPEGCARFDRLDVTNGSEVAVYFAGVENLAGIVHAVGRVDHGRLVDCDEAIWRQSMSVNLDGAFHVLKSALPKLTRPGGSVVLIASIVSSIKGYADRAAYGTAKAGLIGLTKSIARDHLAEGIRANAVCPGTIDSPSLRARIRDLAPSVGGIDAAEATFLARQPTGRFGTPEEVAAACAFLLADESAYVTGQCLVVDGGATL